MTSTNLYAHRREHFLTKIVLDDLQPPEYLVRLNAQRTDVNATPCMSTVNVVKLRLVALPDMNRQRIPVRNIKTIQKTVKKKKMYLQAHITCDYIILMISKCMIKPY